MIDEMNLSGAAKNALPKARTLGAPLARPAARGLGRRALFALRRVYQPEAISLLAAALAWEIIGRVWDISFLPPLSRVVSAAAGLIASGEIITYLLASLTSLAVGYSLALVTGVSLGLLMGRYETVDHLVDPYLTAFLAAPKLVFIPPLYALFGVSRTVQVAVVFLGAFFIMVINARAGMRTVDSDHIDMARSLGATERQLFWRVLLPGALPLTMAGLRIGIGRAIKGMIKGEMFIAVFGLGAMLRRYGSRFDAEHVFAIVLVVVAVALVCAGLVGLLERRVVHWADTPGL
jgi:NitT/TauT family transport system permease protein